MSGFSWSDIPTDLQARVVAGDRTVLNPLAGWLHEHRPRRVSDDVIQKVLGTLCRLMSSGQGRSLLIKSHCVPDFLAGLAAHLRVDERRAEDRLRGVIIRWAALDSARRAPVDPLAILAQGELRRAILSSLASLSPIEREALIRAVMLEQSYRSIATTLLGADSKRNEQRLRKLVHRARKKLEARLKDLGR